MDLVLIIVVVLAALAALIWYRFGKSTPAATPTPSNRFHAVTIHLPEDACPAVRKYASSKFLAKEAPRLPLDECTAPHCRCRYEHYDDRRTEEERRETTETANYQGEQRRARKDRRKTQPTM